MRATHWRSSRFDRSDRARASLKKKHYCKRGFLGLRRLVPRDCVRHQVVRASDGSFPGSTILRHYKALAWPSTVCGGYLAGSSGLCAGMPLGVSGRKIPFPKCALVGPSEATILTAAPISN